MISKPYRADTALDHLLSAKENLVDLKDSMDSAGHAALDLIHRAASTARESNNQALGAINELTLQLQTANNRIKELEAKIEHYQVRAERAERWFTTISTEIQRQFLELRHKEPEQPLRHPNFRIAGS